MKISTLNNRFFETFGNKPERTYFAPGRVNLIGEHIDYNGGLVLPAAIDRGTYFTVSGNETDHINIYSDLFEEQVSIDLQGLAGQAAMGSWTDYITGMLQQLTPCNGILPGSNWLVSSDIPLNSGLSSSASFSVGFGFAMTELLGRAPDRVNLALMAQGVENDFVGVNCGIMDQFAVAMGKSNHCLSLDCESLECELVPMSLENHEIVIVNSKVPRKLSDSAYNTRRSECLQALQILQMSFPVKQLCDLSPEQVNSCARLKDHPALFKRARHACSENQRVIESVSALKQGRLGDFGALMNASHDSLRDDFEVSCKELDLLVDTAQSLPGVVGSRMTGAGFGGCTVSIVETSCVPGFEAKLTEAYMQKTGLNAKVYVVQPDDGVRRIDRSCG